MREARTVPPKGCPECSSPRRRRPSWRRRQAAFQVLGDRILRAFTEA